MIMYQH